VAQRPAANERSQVCRIVLAAWALFVSSTQAIIRVIRRRQHPRSAEIDNRRGKIEIRYYSPSAYVLTCQQIEDWKHLSFPVAPGEEGDFPKDDLKEDTSKEAKEDQDDKDEMQQDTED
jgi:hypothetical protein